MSVTLNYAFASDKKILENLMQFYMYDFSEFVELDVTADGLFGAYDHLEDYWKDKKRFPYIIKNDENLAGFVLVRLIESDTRSYYSIAEFFIMKKYRRQGMGKAIAAAVFNLHKGQWQVYQKENNRPAQLFWHKIIDEYTKGAFTESAESGRLIQDFENGY